MIKLQSPSTAISAEVQLPTSKSMANRLLMLQALSNTPLSNFESETADDIAVFSNAIQLTASKNESTIDVGAAGTAMRFLTAYFSQKPGTYVLKGSARMHQRPITPLVDALKQLGADIQYLENEGYPPLLITGKTLHSNTLTVDASQSSQFISALILLAPFVKGGLQLQLSGNIVSSSYIALTIQMLQQAGVEIQQTENSIKVAEQSAQLKLPALVEADWSAASYYYSICALSKNCTITLPGLFQHSLQGDSCLPLLYENLGVKTTFNANVLTISSQPATCTHFEYDFVNCPDLAQTLAATCFGLGISAKLSGLQTLAIKETDRLLALKTELEKCGAQVDIDANSLFLHKRGSLTGNNPTIATYHDHRMAMSFAPLAVVLGSISIADEHVVTKSYPLFWKHLTALGFNVNLQPQ